MKIQMNLFITSIEIKFIKEIFLKDLLKNISFLNIYLKKKINNFYNFIIIINYII